MDPQPLRELLRRAQENDSTAQSELVERVYPEVQRLAHRALSRDFRKHNAWIATVLSTGDVVHDVLGELSRNLQAFDRDDERELVRYLARMVRNRLVDVVRLHRAERRDVRRKEDSAPEDAVTEASGPPTRVALGEQVRLFRECIAEFGDKPRALLERRLVDGDSFPDIARELGYASSDAARKLFHDAHARLLLKLHARGVRPPNSSRDEL